MKNLIHLISCLLIGCVVASCTPLATLHLVGTKEIDSSFEKGPYVEGEACGYSIFIFPVRVATLDKAIEDALVKGDGEFLLDIKASSDFWTIPLLYFHQCYHAEGWVLRAKP